jgi:hypothetical protein
LALAALGCGRQGPAVGNVKGDVTYQGKRLTSGRIAFHPQSGGEPNVGAISRSGTYVMNEIPAGSYRVTIKTPNPPPAGKPPIALPGRPAPVYIPDQYADAASSNLTVEVKVGKTEHYDIELP